jgi:hypothetical protein
LILLGCAPSPERAFQEALAEDTDLPRALQLCAEAGEHEEECVATVVRGHPDAPLDRCAALADERWRSECAFGIAEARAKAGDRWGALSGCGQAGAYYNECLYHAWTFELQRAADSLEGGAVGGMERARPIIAYWSQIGTVGEDAEELLWTDWWYFAHSRNKPAVYAACALLADPTDRDRCERGTRGYVRRAAVEHLVRASTPAATRDRLCRGGLQDARVLLGELYTPEPLLDAELLDALAAGCAPGRVERPWNPTFRPRGARG